MFPKTYKELPEKFKKLPVEELNRLVFDRARKTVIAKYNSDVNCCICGNRLKFVRKLTVKNSPIWYCSACCKYFKNREVLTFKPIGMA